MIRTDLIPFVLGAVFGATAVLLDAHGWLLHAFARILRAQWFTPAQRCPRCGREVHLLRHHPERAGAWGLADLGDRCVMCSGPEGSLRRQHPPRRARFTATGTAGRTRHPAGARGTWGRTGALRGARGHNHQREERAMTRDRYSPGSDPLPQEAVTVETMPWTGDNFAAVREFAGDSAQLPTQPYLGLPDVLEVWNRPGVRVDPVSGWPLGGQGQAGRVLPHLPGCHSGDLRARGRGSGHGQPGRPAGRPGHRGRLWAAHRSRTGRVTGSPLLRVIPSDPRRVRRLRRQDLLEVATQDRRTDDREEVPSPAA